MLYSAVQSEKIFKRHYFFYKIVLLVLLDSWKNVASKYYEDHSQLGNKDRNI